MPTYTFQNRETEVESTEFMWISEVEAYLAEHPELKLAPIAAAKSVDPWRMGRQKPDPEFRALLKGIDKFYRGNNMEYKGD